MIVTLFLDMIFALVWLITYPVRSLNDAILPIDISNAIATSRGYLFAVDFVVPTGSIIAIFALLIIIEGAILLWKGINWLLRRLPTQS